MPNRALVTSYTQDLGRFPDRWHKLGLVVWAVALIAILVGADGRWISIANLGCVAVVGSVGLMILTALVTLERTWFVAPAILLLLVAVLRVLAWLFHGAALMMPMIVPELVIGGLLLLASKKLAEVERVK